MFVDDTFTFSPPTVLDCGLLCTGARPIPTYIDTGDFAKLSSKGMYGRPEMKNVASLMLPGYLLPLLNILVTVMFIETFSPMLGGDIEIPGLSKVF